jgi:predicted negative regulator of RcsB-dependent stress response
MAGLLVVIASLWPGTAVVAQGVDPLPWNREIAPLPVRIEAEGDRMTMVFDWRLPVAAAVFQRAGTLWIVFDEPGELDLAPLRSAMAGRLVPLSVSVDSKAMILRFDVLGNPKIKVGKEVDSWQITLADGAEPPDHAIPLSQTETTRQGVRAFVPLKGPGHYIKIRDPEAGDLLHIIPLLSSSSGVVSGSEFGNFEVLPTAQGLAVDKVANDVEMARYSNGVAIGPIKLLAASSPPLPAGARVISVMDRDTAPARMIDLEVWRLGGLEKFNANQRMLNRRLAGSGAASGNARRWDLARFYLAHAMYIEARAYLNLMVETDPLWASKPRYMAVRALVEAGLGHAAGALQLISAPELDAEPDISLWRSRFLAANGWHQEALETYERGRSALALFEPQEAAEFRLAAFAAAVERGELEIAEREVGALRRLGINRRQEATMNYLEGRLKEARGAVPEAMALYAAVAESSVRPASGRARLALIELRLARREIEPATAIEALESLRYSWRGDTFELQLARVLGRLYLDQRNYRAGLTAMRRAVVQFPSHSEAQILTQAMSEAFRQLFLNGQFDDLQALSTLALYSEFKELTPLGAEGDLMIRQLAERLVELDLLDQAADLLAHQVQFRSKGSDRATVATRLAEIHILNWTPEAGLAILLETAHSGLPNQTVRSRSRVRARALIALGRFAEAAAAIRSDREDLAEVIRAEIYWRAQRWPELKRSSAVLVSKKIRDGSPLGQDERQVLIKYAIALAIIGDHATLERLRRDFAGRMRTGFFSTAFDLITQPQEFTANGLRELVTGTASVELLRNFMSQYRRDFVVGTAAPGQ